MDSRLVGWAWRASWPERIVTINPRISNGNIVRLFRLGSRTKWADFSADINRPFSSAIPARTGRETGLLSMAYAAPSRLLMRLLPEHCSI